MNLKYSIPNKLYWIDNFLDYNTYKNIHNSIFRERKQINFYSTENVWGKFLYKNLVPPMKTEINGYKPIESLITLLKHNPYWESEYELIVSSTGFERHLIPVKELIDVKDTASKTKSTQLTLDKDFGKINNPDERSIVDVLIGIEKALLSINNNLNKLN